MSESRDFLLPDLGEGLTEAEIVRWLVRVGDTVTVDQPVVEVETAKAAVEVPTPYAGVVTELHGAEGGVLEVGRPLISVAEAGAPATAPAAREGFAEPGVVTATGDGAAEESGNVLVGYGTAEPRRARRRRIAVPGQRPPGTGATPVGTSIGTAAGPAAGSSAVGGPVTRPANDTALGRPQPVNGLAVGNGMVAAPTPAAAEPRRERVPVSSPVVRRLAREHGIDPQGLRGSGAGGLVVRRDVEAAIARSAAQGGAGAGAATPAAGGTERRIPLRGVRRAVAEQMSRSRREIPEATVWVDVDASGLLAVRKEINAADPERPVGLLALLGRFCALGLRRFPELNSTVDTERDEIVLHSAVHLGFAAQTDRGLVVPVVRDAGDASARELTGRIGKLTDAARTGRLSPTDLTGGTFTVNNYGVFGVDGSAAIINHPEAAILGLGRIIDRPWVVDGQLAVRPVTELTLAFDHRVCDGRVAGGFLRFVADCVERPTALLGDL